MCGVCECADVTGSFLSMTMSMNPPAAVAFKQRLFELGNYMVWPPSPFVIDTSVCFRERVSVSVCDCSASVTWPLS